VHDPSPWARRPGSEQGDDPPLGRPLIEWQVDTLHEQGSASSAVLSRKDTRTAVRSRMCWDTASGMASAAVLPVPARQVNVGSGERPYAIWKYWEVGRPGAGRPDRLRVRVDLAAMVHAHRTSGAVLTVGSSGTSRSRRRQVRRHGPNEMVGAPGFLEKPSLAAGCGKHGPGQRPWTPMPGCTGGLRLLPFGCWRPGVGRHAVQPADWGRDCCPGWSRARCAGAGMADRAFGDLGSPRDYLDTMRAVLGGDLPPADECWPPASGTTSRGLHESSLRLRDRVTGRTLADRIRHGLVTSAPATDSARTSRSAPAPESPGPTWTTASTSGTARPTGRGLHARR